MQYAYYIRKDFRVVDYTVRAQLEKIKFYPTKTEAAKDLPNSDWEVAVYRKTVVPGLQKLSSTYTTNNRKLHGIATIACSFLRDNGRKVLAKVVEREFKAIIERERAQYFKRKAKLLQEIENGRPN